MLLAEQCAKAQAQHKEPQLGERLWLVRVSSHSFTYVIGDAPVHFDPKEKPWQPNTNAF